MKRVSAYFSLGVCCLLLLAGHGVSAQQTGVVKGRIFDVKNNEAVPFANVVVYQTTVGAAADADGNFRIENVPVGFTRLEVSSVGYKT